MLREYVPMEMDDGSTLYIQAVPVNNGSEVLAGAPDVVKATECLDKAMPAVNGFCKKMKEFIRTEMKPDEIELEFSVSFTGDMSAVITSAGAEAGITVHLVWKEEKI